MKNDDYFKAIAQMLIEINENHLLKLIYTVVKSCYENTIKK